MYKNVVVSWDKTEALYKIGVTNNDTIFVWVKGDTVLYGQQVVLRAHVDAEEALVYPAFTADELAHVLARICHLHTTFLALNINHATEKFSDVLAETLIDAVTSGSISVDDVKKCVGVQNPLDTVRVGARKFSAKARQEMFQVVFDFTGDTRYTASKKVGEYTLAFTKYSTSDVLFIAIGREKNTVVSRTRTGEIVFVEGSDAILADVANKIVKLAKGGGK